MGNSITGFRILEGILSGAIDSAALETLLADPYYIGPYRALINSIDFRSILNSDFLLVPLGSETAFSELLSVSGDSLAASLSATQLIAKSTTAIRAVLTDEDNYNLWANVPANYTNLLAQINATDSKIIQHEYLLADDGSTWTFPASGLNAISVVCIGKGGDGGSWVLNSNHVDVGRNGGSGGELQAWADLNPSFSGNQTIDTSGDAAFGALLTALEGLDASTSSVGTDANGAGASLTTTDFDNMIWNRETLSVEGGTGGRASNFATTPLGGGNSTSLGTGGAAGSDSSPATTGLAGGTCAGGGGGGANNGNPTTFRSGTHATDYGAGGGGAAGAFYSSVGGNGGPALVKVMAIID